MSSEEETSSERGLSSPPSLSLAEQPSSEEEEESSRPSSSPAAASDEVAVALPPRSFLPPPPSSSEHDPALLSGSTTLELLDQLVTVGGLGKERAARLRRSYNALRDTLEGSRVLEGVLLDRAKELGQQVSSQQRLLEQASSFPDLADNTENGRLRQVLLHHQNQLDQAQQRIDKLEHESNLLEEERAQVEREYNRMPKKEELEQHIKELSRHADELRDEVALRSQDVQRYREDLDRKSFKLSALRQEAEDLRHVEEVLQSELIELRTGGPNIPREIDSIKKQQTDCRDQMSEQNLFLQELLPQISEAEGRGKSLGGELATVAAELAGKRSAVEGAGLDLDRLHKDLSTAKEREATVLEDKATLELRLKHRAVEQRSLFEALSRKTREKEAGLKTLKKAELQLDSLRQSAEQIERQSAVLSQRLAVQSEAGAELRRKRSEVMREVEALRRAIKHTEGVGEGRLAEVEQRQTEEDTLRAELKKQQTRLHHLNRDVITMTKSRDHDAKEYYQARRQVVATGDDLRTREAQLDEQRKLMKQLEGELRDFATAYEVVKAERNKTHGQIQLLTQLGAELQEKGRILANEMEVLRSSAETKDKVLQKCGVVYSAKVLERDSQRGELARLKLGQADLLSELQTQRELVHKLTRLINATEDSLNRLRRDYKSAVQDRNDTGLQLIERTEEACVFHEKLRVQESVVRSANLKLRTLEEELRFIRMELSRLQNDVLVNRKLLPGKEHAEMELVSAQGALRECRERLRWLEGRVEGVGGEEGEGGRQVRMLPGEQPSRYELKSRLEKLEAQLTAREQKLLERELLFEQVSKLAERAHGRSESQRESTLAVAKSVNGYQARIKEVTRRMMALVSELSMQQSSALRLQQEVREGEGHLEQAYQRLAKGEAPDNEAAATWTRMVAEENKRNQQLDRQEGEELVGVAFSHAEPRPNAYMPSGEGDLPIPKPYGSHAPFKPSLSGSNIRHIRKPQLKPIDI